MLPIVDKIIHFGDSNLILSAVIGFDDFGAGMQIVFGLINLNHTLIGVFGVFFQLSQVFAFNLEIGIFTGDIIPQRAKLPFIRTVTVAGYETSFETDT